MTFVSYAQNFEDVLLWRALGEVTNGFYVDIGASHPDIDSVTRAFYDRGWHGINVEPTIAAFVRLQQARPRDTNLRLALAESPGKRPFYVVEGADHGLSTVNEHALAQLEAIGLKSVATMIDVDTLAAVCRQHVKTDIHFLKIDVEGAERAVLEGADFDTYRPWIVLVEATAPMSTREMHAEWDDLLVKARYHFVWFDGLNRFYVADEHHARLEAKFRIPPNVFDNFLRAADTEWTRRLTEAETRAGALLARALAAETRVAIANDLAEAAHLRYAQAATGAARHEAAAARSKSDNDRLQAEQNRLQADHDRLRTALEDARHREHALRERAEWAERARDVSGAWLDAMRRSTSWRITGPLRRFGRAARGARPGDLPPEPEPEPVLPATDPAVPARCLVVATVGSVALAGGSVGRRSVRAVHQFHSGTAIGDAITNAMLLTRRVLRDLGYDSHIFAEHRAPGCTDEIHPIDALPQHDQYALIVRHSMGHNALDRILAMPAPKVLLYHNITPPEMLRDNPHTQQYARLGRRQLEELRPAVVAALADSEFNALELRRAGFGSVGVCPLLFDLDRLLSQAPPPRRSHVFTILFVGRLSRSKGQIDLVRAYARFRSMYAGESRLVLVGRNDSDVYANELFGLIRQLKLDTGAVEVTGLVSDDELGRRYAEADLYISLSHHEGFGVPLIEAMAHEVPILAFGSGAVPYTLGGASALLEDATPTRAAERMHELASNPSAREAITRRQRRSLDRFRLERLVPVLISALEKAGVQAPETATTIRAVTESMQFTVAGHVNGSYSLAEINRTLAAELEASRPGSVRLLAVEGDVTTDLSGVPVDQRDQVRVLVTRLAPASGPHVVVSQHYPVWPPPERGDLALALFYWEESLVPAATVKTLNASFDGVLAPSFVVAKALIDSGVEVPVRVLGHAPRLGRYRALRDERANRQISGQSSGPFTFLHVSSGFPRKGVDVLLAAYATAFRRTDDVVLVIKVFPNPHNTVAADVERLRTDPDAPAVELIDGDLPEAALLDLYRRADVMVLPTRGEGYNLPAAEALASGMKLIVTGYGGHMDFVDRAPSDSVRLLCFTLTPADTHLSTPFSLWAEPDLADLAIALREAADEGRRGDLADFRAMEEPLATRLSRIAAELLQRPWRPAPRIAFMTTWHVPCGIAGYSRSLTKHLPRPTAILADRRTRGSDDEKHGAPVIPAWSLGLDGDLQDFSSALLRVDPDVLVIQHQPGLIPWSALPKLIGLPALHDRVVCAVLHNTRHLTEVVPKDRMAALVALAQCARIVVHTVHDIERLARLGLHSNVTLIPQGVPVGEHREVQVRELLPDSAILIGCYGFFLPDKGILQLVEALALVRERFPRARLRLVNAAYPATISTIEINACLRLVAGLGLQDDVEFVTEFLPEQRSTELLTDCDVIVLPYQHSREASSAALRSAMQAGVPIAVTPLSLFDEAEDAVFRLAGTEHTAMAEGLKTLLLDADLRRRVAAKAARWASLRDWQNVAVRWNGMLQGLAASRMMLERDRGPGSVR